MSDKPVINEYDDGHFEVWRGDKVLSKSIHLGIADEVRYTFTSPQNHLFEAQAFDSLEDAQQAYDGRFELNEPTLSDVVVKVHEVS